jgi:hypothetical protein
MSTLQQLIAEGNGEIERSVALLKEARRLIAERHRLHDEFCALRNESNLSLAQTSAWLWKCCEPWRHNRRASDEG